MYIDSDSKKNQHLRRLQDFLIGELRNQNAVLQHEFGAHGVSSCTTCEQCDQSRDSGYLMYIPVKFNMELENTCLEKENHLPNHDFQVPC